MKLRIVLIARLRLHGVPPVPHGTKLGLLLLLGRGASISCERCRLLRLQLDVRVVRHQLCGAGVSRCKRLVVEQLCPRQTSTARGERESVRWRLDDDGRLSNKIGT